MKAKQNKKKKKKKTSLNYKEKAERANKFNLIFGVNVTIKCFFNSIIRKASALSTGYIKF